MVKYGNILVKYGESMVKHVSGWWDGGKIMLKLYTYIYV